MKKTLLPLAMLGLAIGSPVFAKSSVTNIVKVLGFTEIIESGEATGYMFDVKTPKGYINIYIGDNEEARQGVYLDHKSASILNHAYKTKSCVKITERESLKTTVQKVECPKKLPKIKSLYY